MNIISVINGGAVGIFGMLLSAAFCEIVWTKRNRRIFLISMAAILLFQGVLYIFLDSGMVQHLYPLITHLPLALVLCFLSRNKLWAPISVLTAYLCCQLRRWAALLVVAFAGGEEMVQGIAEIVFTVPLLLLLIRFIAPSVREISHYTVSVQCVFGIIPALGYGFDYLTRIYTDLLSKGAPVAVEFMPFVCSVAYLIFVLRASEEARVRSQLEQVQDSLNMQVTQAVREIEVLRDSEWKAKTYRHDLRHHMQYLLTCMENGKTEQAENYIHGIFEELEADKVTVFCENEAANLIFSSFARRMKEQGIFLKIKAEIPQNLSLPECDLCVLLSNALENALHACQGEKEKGNRASVEALVYEQSGKLFLQIVNSCGEKVLFENGIPVTDKQGHGIGVRSICAIVDKYGGIYSFSAEGGSFTLRISI